MRVADCEQLCVEWCGFGARTSSHDGFDPKKQLEESWRRVCVFEQRDLDHIRCAVKNTLS